MLYCHYLNIGLSYDKLYKNFVYMWYQHSWNVHRINGRFYGMELNSSKYGINTLHLYFEEFCVLSHLANELIIHLF